MRRCKNPEKDPPTVYYSPRKEVSHLYGEREKTGCLISITNVDLCGPHSRQGSSNLKSSSWFVWNSPSWLTCYEWITLGKNSSCILSLKKLKKTKRYILGYEQYKLQRNENQTKMYTQKYSTMFWMWQERKVWQSMGFSHCNVNNSFKREPFFLCPYHWRGFPLPSL